jgi:hypothetical protein
MAPSELWFLSAVICAILLVPIVGCESGGGAGPLPVVTGQRSVEKRSDVEPVLRDGEWGVVIGAPHCVTVDSETGSIRSLVVQERYRLKTDCVAVKERKHPELGLGGWVFFRDAETGKVYSNALNADEAPVAEPDLESSVEPPCDERAGTSVAGKNRIETSALFDLPSREATYRVHVAYGWQRSNEITVRVVKAGGLCDAAKD